jgi:hypothetical protein
MLGSEGVRKVAWFRRVDNASACRQRLLSLVCLCVKIWKVE